MEELPDTYIPNSWHRVFVTGAPYVLTINGAANERTPKMKSTREGRPKKKRPLCLTASEMDHVTGQIL